MSLSDRNISSRCSKNAEANASEFQENLDKIVSSLLVVDDGSWTNDYHLKITFSKNS